MQMIVLVWLVLLPATTLAGAIQLRLKHSDAGHGPSGLRGHPRCADGKKSAFFDYLMPFVLRRKCRHRGRARRPVLQMEAINAAGRALTSAQQADLLRLAKRYRLPTAQHNGPTDKLIAQVLQRVDVVPASLSAGASGE